MFDTIFQSDSTGSVVTVTMQNAIISILVALALGLVISITYMKTSKVYSKNFASSLIVIPDKQLSRMHFLIYCGVYIAPVTMRSEGDITNSNKLTRSSIVYLQLLCSTKAIRVSRIVFSLSSADI